jgi:hypothetical protein
MPFNAKKIKITNKKKNKHKKLNSSENNEILKKRNKILKYFKSLTAKNTKPAERLK